MLQTRNGKRTGAAAVKIACDMVKEKLITEKEAVLAYSSWRPDSVAAAQLQSLPPRLQAKKEWQAAHRRTCLPRPVLPSAS